MNYVFGFLFGLASACAVWVYAGASILTANAICLTVIGTIWLGISIAPDQSTRCQLQELAIAIINLGIVILAFFHSPFWIYAGFLIQGIWSIAHIGGSAGARAQGLYPGFAVMANLGYLVTLLTVWKFA